MPRHLPLTSWQGCLATISTRAKFGERLTVSQARRAEVKAIKSGQLAWKS